MADLAVCAPPARPAWNSSERIGEAYGLVLLLILVTFVVMMTLPPEGWGGRVAAVAVAGLTAVIGLTSSDVRAARVRLAVAVAVLAVLAALIAQAVSSVRLVGLAFGADAILLAIAALTILRRVILGASQVDFRTILGAISVFTLLGLLFAFLFVAFANASHADFFTGVARPEFQRLPLLQLHDAHDDRLRQPGPRWDRRAVLRGLRDARRPVLPRHARRWASESLASRRSEGGGRRGPLRPSGLVLAGGGRPRLRPR